MPLVVTIFGTILYHIGQKSLPSTCPPGLALILSYSVCLVLSVLYSLYSRERIPMHQFPWSIIAIGVGAALIEFGYLIAYRHGWQLSSLSVKVHAAAAALLIPLGFLVYRETVNAMTIVGIVLCLSGVYCLSQSTN